MNRIFAFLPITLIACSFVIHALTSAYNRLNSIHETPAINNPGIQPSTQRILQGSEKDILFIENLGQITDTDGENRPDVLFLTRSEGVDIYLTKSGIIYVFKTYQNDVEGQFYSSGTENEEPQGEPIYHRLDMEFVGVNQDINVKKELAVDQKYHYYTPAYPDGISPRAYKKLIIENLYDGIDLAYYEQDGRMKYDFILKAGADPGSIQMTYRGASSMEIDPEGSLVVTTPMGEVREEKPYTYSGSTGSEIQNRYQLQDSTVLFDIAEYDQSEGIIIDPVRVWATFYGGNDSDLGWSVCTDHSGNLYVTGRTSSSDLPIQSLTGAYEQFEFGGERDAFVVKFNSSGQKIWATYYGGSAHDVGWSICSDHSGNVHVAGRTASSDFPVQALEGAYNQTTYGGGDFDAFILRFDSSGTRQWATYYGGDAEDVGWSICSDRTGNIHVTGQTASSDFPAQTLEGAYNQTTYGGGDLDAFILTFDSSGTRQWATYYGGSDSERARSICADESANIYLTGRTASSDFPTQALEGAYNQTTYGGGDIDAFVLTFDSNGTRQWATYYGGSGEDQGLGICTDHSANIYVTGRTASSNFPTQILEGAYNQSNYGGGNFDAFILKFDSIGARQWATYCGGSALDRGIGLCTDPSGNLFVSGRTASSDFPTGASSGDYYQDELRGNNDVFIMQFDISGFPQWATYYGGGGSDWGESILIDNARNLYVTGATWSGSFPTLELPGAYNQNAHGGGFNDAFLLKFDLDPMVATNDVPGDGSEGIITHLSIYPNPASESLTIQYQLHRKSELMMWITDLAGTPVYSQHTLPMADMQENHIDVGQIPPGIYFLSLQSESQVVSRKIAIQR